jgi:hypothetical protein
MQKIWAHFLLRKKPGFAGVPPLARPLRAPPIPCAVGTSGSPVVTFITGWIFATQNSTDGIGGTVPGGNVEWENAVPPIKLEILPDAQF